MAFLKLQKFNNQVLFFDGKLNGVGFDLSAKKSEIP